MAIASSRSEEQKSEAKTHALIAYILLAVGMFTAIPMLVGAIWAMVKRSESKGTIYHSHYSNIIRTFWWMVVWMIIGGVTTLLLIGWLILALTWIWVVYRLINGLSKITSDIAYPL